MLKRKKLENYYSKLDDCLKQIDKDDNISILNTSIGNRDILKVHDEQKNRLGKIDYYLLVAGNRKHRVWLFSPFIYLLFLHGASTKQNNVL